MSRNFKRTKATTDRYSVWISWRRPSDPAEMADREFYSTEPIALWSAFLRLCAENGHRLGPKNFIAARRFDDSTRDWVKYTPAQFHHAVKQALDKSPISVTELEPSEGRDLDEGQLPLFCNRCGRSLAEYTSRIAPPERINLLWKLEEPVVFPCPHCGEDLSDRAAIEETSAADGAAPRHWTRKAQVSPLRIQFNAASKLYQAVFGGFGGAGEKDINRAAAQFYQEALALLQRTKLTDDQRLVLRERFGFSGRVLTLKAVGQSLGHTTERAREIQNFALRKMRHPAHGSQAFLLAGDITVGQELGKAKLRLATLEAELAHRTAAIKELEEQVAILVQRTAEFGLDAETVARATKMTIKELGLSALATNALGHSGITRVLQVFGLDAKTLLGWKFPGFGDGCLRELNAVLVANGFPPIIGTKGELLNTPQTQPPFSGKTEAGTEAVGPKAPPVVPFTRIETLGLSDGTFLCLKRRGILFVHQLTELTEADILERHLIRNFGAKSLAELNAALEAKGFAGIRKG